MMDSVESQIHEAWATEKEILDVIYKVYTVNNHVIPEPTVERTRPKKLDNYWFNEKTCVIYIL